MLNIHETATDVVERDRFFVYEIIKRLFDTETQFQTITGTPTLDSTSGTVVHLNQLNRETLNFAYAQYQKRVIAVGINIEDRKARSERSYFNDYVRMLTDLEHQKRRRREKRQPNPNLDPNQNATKTTT